MSISAVQPSDPTTHILYMNFIYEYKICVCMYIYTHTHTFFSRAAGCMEKLGQCLFQSVNMLTKGLRRKSAFTCHCLYSQNKQDIRARQSGRYPTSALKDGPEPKGRELKSSISLFLFLFFLFPFLCSSFLPSSFSYILIFLIIFSSVFLSFLFITFNMSNF